MPSLMMMPCPLKGTAVVAPFKPTARPRAATLSGALAIQPLSVLSGLARRQPLRVRHPLPIPWMRLLVLAAATAQTLSKAALLLSLSLTSKGPSPGALHAAQLSAMNARMM